MLIYIVLYANFGNFKNYFTLAVGASKTPVHLHPSKQQQVL